MRNPRATVKVESVSGNDSFDGIVLDGSQHDGRIMHIVNQGGYEGVFDNFYLKNIQNYTGEHLLRIEDYDGDIADFGKFYIDSCVTKSDSTIGFAFIGNNSVEKLTIRDSYTDCDEAVRTQGGDIEQLIYANTEFPDSTEAWADFDGTVNALVQDDTAEASLGGSAPDATIWPRGTTVEDSDNPGTLYYVYDNTVSGGVTQIG